MAKEKGPLFTPDDVKGNIIMNLQTAKKQLRNKIFTKNCHKAQYRIRKAKTLDELLRVIEHYDMSRYLTNGTKHMLQILKANEACPHMKVSIQFEDGEVKQANCKDCGIPLKFITIQYVPEGPEGEIVGTFTVGKK